MKKLLLFLIILVTTLAAAQMQRFTYEYVFRPDSLNKQKVIAEIMNLDITQEGSLFYSSLLLKRDSAFMAQAKPGKTGGTVIINLNSIKRSQVHFIISKEYPTFKTVYHTSFNALRLAVNETKKITWKIEQETKRLAGFPVQKATTQFAGRKWIAWFSPEIQIPDGPYKFSGLPGLIVQVDDEDGDHAFTLVGIQKQNTTPFHFYGKTKEIVVSEEKFNQLWNEYKKDPAKNIKLIHSSSEMSETLFYDPKTGNPLTKQELIRNKEEGDKQFFMQYNNYIERQLYK